jgi:hypothetical protein
MSAALNRWSSPDIRLLSVAPRVFCRGYATIDRDAVVDAAVVQCRALTDSRVKRDRILFTD